MPKKQKLPLPQGYTRKFETEDFPLIQMSLRHTTLFSVMSLCAWLLRQVRPESQWRERVKKLLDDYSDVSLSAMGFPDDWREYALWK